MKRRMKRKSKQSIAREREKEKAKHTRIKKEVYMDLLGFLVVYLPF